jgi:hypothetical protein
VVGSKATKRWLQILVDTCNAGLASALYGGGHRHFGVDVRHLQGSYLVDPASSHMLVSKIKPCMSKYKLLIL